MGHLLRILVIKEAWLRSLSSPLRSLEFAAAAKVAYDQARKLGLGREVPTEWVHPDFASLEPKSLWLIGVGYDKKSLINAKQSFVFKYVFKQFSRYFVGI